MLNVKKLFLLFLAVFLVQVFSFPFGKNKINYQPQQWKKLNTVHFSIYYSAGSEDAALLAARIAEEGYIHVSNYLQYEPTKVIPIVLYPSRVEFQNNNISQDIIGESVGGFTESLMNRVVVPYVGSFAEFRHVLVHELVHAFQFNMLFYDTQGDTRIKIVPYRIPVWVIEGMAEYFTLGFDEMTDMFMRDVILNERYSGLVNMTNYMAKTGYAYYKEGQSFYYFYEHHFGKESIGELFRDLRDMRSIDKALMSQTGKGLVEMNEEWLRFYKRRYAHLMYKKFDTEEGTRLTNHVLSGSTINLYPAVSPEGERIAFLSNKDLYASIVVMNIKDGRKIEKAIIRGNKGAQYEEMLTRSNGISWSGDGKSLGFCAQTMGKEAVFIVDAGTGAIKHKIVLPLKSVADPSLSYDGKKVVLSGFGDKWVDIYIYSIDDKSLENITGDDFFDRFPKFSRDGSRILYSSKYNDMKHSLAGDYDIYQIELSGKKKDLLVGTPGDDIHGEFSKEGTSVLFSSNKTGIYNIYRKNIKEGTIDKLTDVNTGTFSPRFFPDENKIAFVNYQRLGYDIYIKDSSESDPYPDTDEKDALHQYIAYPAVELDVDDYRYVDYKSGLTPDWLALGVAAALNYGIIGYAQASLTDFLGDHKVVGTVNYFRDGRENLINFDISYYYLKERWDFCIGGFRRSNPLWLYSIDDINDLIHNVNFGTESMDHYGGYLCAIYPFSRFLRASARLTGARYEVDYSDDDVRRDVSGNIGQISLSLVFDNVLWGLMVPLDGFRGKISFDQSFPLFGDDLIYTSVSMDLREYFLIYREYVIALRFSCGRIFGPDGKYFQYYIGGYNTLRGYDLFAIHGKSMYILSGEFRFTLIENFQLAWPVHIGFGDFGGVLFVDAGSAWDDRLVIYDRDERSLRDFNFDIGCGIRFVIYPVTILKLDFAWPFDRKSFEQCEILFSLGLEF